MRVPVCNLRFSAKEYPLKTFIINVMSVLVTGGTGMVGHALQKIVKESGDTRQWFFAGSDDADLTIFATTLELYDRVQPTYVINLAADVGGMFKNMDQKVEMFENNILMNMNVLKCSHKWGVQKVVSCLSTCIFPDAWSKRGQLDETMLHLGPPHVSNMGYAYAKRMVDVLSHCYNEKYSLNRFVTVTPTNLYGPYDNFSSQSSHVFPAIIKKCADASTNSTAVELRGTGQPLRQFLYSEDLARVILWMLDNYSDDETLIVAPTEEISIKELAEMIASKFGIVEQLCFNGLEEEDGQYRKTSSNTKFLNFYDFQFTPLKIGLEKTINWYNEHYMSISDK